MTKKKKIVVLSLISVVVTVPVIGLTVAATTSDNIAWTAKDASKKYDVSLSTLPISSLNYIRYADVNKVLPSLVEGITKSGVSEAIKQRFHLPEFSYRWYESNVSSLDDYLTKPEDLNKLTKVETSNSYYPISNFFTAGSLYTGDNGSRAMTSIVNKENLVLSTRFALNKGGSKWSNSDEVVAQDFRDSAEYILDLSTGSQHLTTFLTLNIRGAKEFIDAQQAYQKIFKTPFINPFGRREYYFDKDLQIWRQNLDGKFKDFSGKEYTIYTPQLKTDGDGNLIDYNGDLITDESGNKLTAADEQKYIDKIKEAALNLGIYTGQRYLDFSNEFVEKQLNLAENGNVKITDSEGNLQPITITVQKEINGKSAVIKDVKLIPNPCFDPRQIKDWRNSSDGQYKPYAFDRYDLRYEFDESAPPSLINMINTMDKGVFVPVNRRFIETKAGGILNFGNKLENFITSGPFVIESLELGAQGNIVIKKNEQYYDVDRVIPRKIIIYFNDNPVVLINMFKAGQISAADMPSSMHLQMWSDPNFKKYLVKSAGFGTIGMQFNLDPNTEANPLLKDSNLRNAIAYSIDRNDMLNLVGWQASFPVINWTAFNTSRTKAGVPLEAYFEDVKVKAKNYHTYPIQNYGFVDHLSKNYTFENLKRDDKMFSFETARFYIEEFKRAHPEVDVVNLKYIYDGSKEKERAGISLQNQVNKAFGGFVKINLKSYPPNTYAQFRSEGKFDITYYNFDYFGTDYDGYVRAFLEKDEINPKASKTLGFQTNPSGAWTYLDYFIPYDQAKKENKNWLIKNYIIKEDRANEALEILKNIYLHYTKELAVGAYVNEREFSKILTQFSNRDQITEEFIKLLYDQETWAQIEGTYNVVEIQDRIKLAFDKIQAQKTLLQNIIKSSANQEEFNKIIEYLIKNENGDFARLRLQIKEIHWNKIRELSSTKKGETIEQRTKRLNQFFSLQFTREELSEGWSEEEIFRLIVSFEKILRDSNPVIPLMEVDTKWQVSHVGGVNSLFTFALQYAYDVTKPPLPNLPTTISN
ncbi:Stage 0 sporulation protein KA [Mycoplasmopsis californica]|uniref:ABC transporter substrate-binding protein n=1 Tax=Mycoplasmopsis equigenitalium TaxID=114883 RepID=A0ABY5J152_9BACT|nr:ABC transporter substrate-binding protein [Mycoplasmopsis equigenitalium]UUD36974.1 ABC transporter substrate-binding protein [Mycoplasmopsis equigenitalium]VEU69730.1 Stage 0 sporulation protein KA [Mycoplasmopsis californica]